jgi:hypothetical protein
LPPGSALPNDCAARVPRSSWEPRPENNKPNHYVPQRGTDYSIRPWDSQNFGMNDAADALARRIDGNFTGTTDEIIRWGACKWGFDEDIVRAVAVTESWWRQSQLGDFVDGQPTSYGLLQVKKTVHTITYPGAQQSTALNVDYALAYRRACYEGLIEWLGNPAGDEWGCVGHWFSGGWKDAGAQNYVSIVQNHLAQRTWAQPGF